MSNQELYNRKWLLKATKGNQVREWDDIRIEFKVQLFGSAQLNELDLSITNLNRDSRSFFQAKQSEIEIELWAGYDANFGRIFKGHNDIVNNRRGDGVTGYQKYFSSKDDTDWITTITAKDGIKQTKNKIFSVSFKGDTPSANVVKSITEKTGLPVGVIKTNKIKKKNHKNGLTLKGNTFNKLTKYLSKDEMFPDIQHNVIHVRHITEAINEEIILLDQESGLIGTPELTEKGIKAKSLIRHDMYTGRIVELKSENSKGLFLITNVIHEGDSDSENWYTNIEAQKYG
jgi:hypothetical protein